SWALTGVKLGIPIKHWSIDKTLNNLTFNYSYSQEMERSPIVEQRFFWIWKFNTKYALRIPDLLSLKPLKWASDSSFFNTYSKMKINFLPSNFSTSLDITRSRRTEKSRFLDFPSPVVRDFSSQRHAEFSWDIVENGMFSPSIDYSVRMSSTLVPFEIDENGRQRTGSELSSIVLFNDGNIIDFGTTNNLAQKFAIELKPKLPLGIYSQYFKFNSFKFETDYSWMNPLQQDPAIRDVAKNAKFNNSIRLNLGISLKNFTEELFGMVPNFTQVPAHDSTRSTTSKLFSTIGNVFKTIFFDFDMFDIDFTQTNAAMNPGVFGGTGLTNFWSTRASESIYGPSMPYQLGLVASPHGGFNMVSSDRFPFFGFDS
ncbi:MAG: hypothetical protein KAH48_01305, partial [Chlorobi bacterium]|nr:hypothetical protein [Chlorobiota bacterium]